MGVKLYDNEFCKFIGVVLIFKRLLFASYLFLECKFREWLRSKISMRIFLRNFVKIEQSELYVVDCTNITARSKEFQNT